MNEDDKKELKRQWKFFLFYGIGIIIVTTLLQFGLNYWLNVKIEGPPCRIDFSVEKFSIKNDTNFNIKYLFINLRDKDLQLEDLSAYCYWKSNEELKQQETKAIINPPSIDQISTPEELPKIEASKSQVKESSCRSPKEEGDYKIRVIASTTEGTCEGNVIMEVIK